MKCLSIRQPWAGLIVTGLKDVENRTWSTIYRGQVLIHASRTYDESEETRRFIEERLGFDFNYPCLRFKPFDQNRGCIIGAVTIYDCALAPCPAQSPWHINGQYGFYLHKVVLFEQPIPFKGRLVEPDLVAEWFERKLKETTSDGEQKV